MHPIRAALLVALACSQAALHGTSYPPVTFGELIARADVIFIGEVIDVRPYTLANREGTIIRTRVTFRVTEPIYGTTSAVELLEFFGGEMNGVGMAIAGMPRFAEGDRRIVFSHREPSINPIVGFTQGLLRIVADANGVDRVVALDGTPISQTDSIGARAPRPDSVSRLPMSLADFRARIRDAIIAERRQ